MIFSQDSLSKGAMALQLGGILSGVAGSFYSAKSQRSSLKFAADMAKINARIAETGAQSVLAQGEREAGALALRYGQMKGSQRAAMAANGVDLGSGSAAEIQASTDLLKETDLNTIQANAVRSAWGYRLQATNYENSALVGEATAGGISPGASAATSLLGGAGAVASSWYRLGKSGKSTAMEE